MPVVTLDATAVGNYNTWDAVGGVKPGVINTDDGDTSYIKKDGGTTGRDSYVMEDIPAAAIVADVRTRLTWRRSETGAGTNRLSVRYLGTDLDGVNLGDPGLTYITQTEVWPSPPGGGSWSGPIVNGTEMGITRQSGAGQVRVTRLWGRCTFDVPGGWFPFAFSWLAVFPFVEDLQGFLARGIAERPRTIWTPEEAAAMWEELRAHPHPRYVFL